MNDTMSLLLATGILAVGGLGLFMYKNSSEEKGKSYNKKEENWFDLSSFFANDKEDDANDYDNGYDIENENEDEDEPEVYETKTRARGSKTKSVRKTTGSKRRY